MSRYTGPTLTLDAARPLLGRRAVYVGVSRTRRDKVKVVSVSRVGVRVRFADGHRERVHPDDLAVGVLG